MKMTDSIWKTISLNNHKMHLRPVQKIVETAGKFDSRITVSFGNEGSDAKSMLDMIVFAAYLVNKEADHFVLRVEGEDRVEAIGALSTTLDELFGKENSAAVDV